MNKEKNKIVIILGAGATAGSGYLLNNINLKIPPPTDRCFFGVVEEVIEKLNRLPFAGNSKLKNSLIKSFFQIMKHYRIAYKSDIGMEEFWNIIVMSREFVQENKIIFDTTTLKSDWDSYADSPSVKMAKWADFYMRILIQYIYGQAIKYNNNHNDKFAKLYELLIIPESYISIDYISFNYDLCLENSLHSKGVKWYYPNFRDIYPQEDISESCRIYKLHGSLNWWHGYDGYIRLKEGDENIYEPIGIDENQYGNEKNYDSYRKYQPAIIPADFIKEEFHNPQGQIHLHQHFMDLWANAGLCLGEADKVIIIGYSFPKADPHARWLMKAATCGLFGSQKKKQIYCITAQNDQKKEIEKTIGYLFESNTEWYDKGFQNIENDTNLKNWIINR